MARKKKYDSYDDRFKATAVELDDLPGVKAIDVAEILDIHPIMLYRWKKEYRDQDQGVRPLETVVGNDE